VIYFNSETSEMYLTSRNSTENVTLYYYCTISNTMLALRSVQASSSRLVVSPKAAVRYLSFTPRRLDIEAEIDKRINPREVIEKKRKEFEDKYGHKLKKKVEA
jgi:hypothetical protein